MGNIKWRVIPLYVEVGCRGTVNQRPWYGMCNDLGFTQTITRRITEAATQTALWCSYLYFPMPIREGVGTETLDGSISVEGYSLDSTRSHHHQSSVQQPQHRHTKEQLQNFLTGHLLTDSVV